MLKKVFLCLGGAAAGFINGLLGTGGGIVIIYLLGVMYKDSDPRDNFATAIAAILPMSVVSAGIYLTSGSFSLSDVSLYILPAIAGGIAGALLLCKIKVNLLKKIFACVVIYAGVNMLIK